MNLAELTAEQRLEHIYSNSAKRIVHSVLRAREKRQDEHGNTSEDYEAILRLKAWMAQRKFLDKGMADPLQESRWVHASLWNAARNMVREREAHKKCLPVADSVDYQSVLIQDYRPSSEDLYIQKEACALLQERLDPRELDILERFGENEQNLTRTLRTYEKSSVGRRKFRKIIRRLRCKAAGLLQGIVLDDEPVSGVAGLYPD